MSESSNEWLAGLSADERAAVKSLRARFEALGASDAATFALSEINDDLPHLARFMLLRSLWRGPIEGWSEAGAFDQLPVARRLLAAGADQEDLACLARAVAYEAVFAVLEQLDSGSDANESGVDVGWLVMEAATDRSPTGRVLSGLHEDLLAMDPSGRDGADLWQ